MKSKRVPFTMRSSMAVIKTAMKTNSVDEAIQSFRNLKSAWVAQGLSSTPSIAPGQVLSQMVELACKEHVLGKFLPELCGLSLSEEVVSTMLLECVRQKDFAMTCSVEKLAREQEVRFTDATYSLLIKGMAVDPVRVH